MLNHEITLQQAIEMTSRYRQNKASILGAGVDADVLAICETFDLASVNKLLSVTGAASLRIYYGMSDNLKVHAILVSADSDGRDILPSAVMAAAAGDETDPTILEESFRCPPLCPDDSPLNS